MPTLEDKTVLVTGASGFIGSHLVARLQRIRGIRLLLISREERKRDDPNVKWLRGSLRELSLEYWLRHGVARIDVVFHLGAFIPRSAGDADDAERTINDNIDGTHALLKGLPKGVLRLVFSSTVDVYAPVKDGIYLTETSPVGPANLYGASKIFCEQLVKTWATQTGTSFAILRYGHIFGPGEAGFRKIIPLTIQRLLNDKAPLVYGTGCAKRDFLYVEDAVEATLRAADSDDDLGPINIVRGDADPIKTVVELLIAQSGVDTHAEFVAGTNDGHSLQFDNRKMRDVLGDWPMVGLKDGLSRELDAARRASGH